MQHLCLFRRTSDIAYRDSYSNGKIKHGSKNLLENLRGSKGFKNSERENNFKVEKVGGKNSVNWNQTDSILHQNQNYFDLIHTDPNYIDSDSDPSLSEYSSSESSNSSGKKY